MDESGDAPPNVFVTSQDLYIYAFALSDGWFAWKAKIADHGPFPMRPVWSADPTELPLKLDMSSEFLQKLFARGEMRAWYRNMKTPR